MVYLPRAKRRIVYALVTFSSNCQYDVSEPISCSQRLLTNQENTQLLPGSGPTRIIFALLYSTQWTTTETVDEQYNKQNNLNKLSEHVPVFVFDLCFKYGIF